MFKQFLTILFLPLLCVAALAGQGGGPTPAEQARMDEQNAALRAMLKPAAMLPMAPAALAVQAPADGWAMGMASWVAAGADGLIYLLQRGDKADPG
jgi:hypothetical protein